MAQAQKHIETKKEGEFEYRKFHVVYFEIPKEVYETLQNMWESDLNEDYEDAYSKGFIGDMDFCLWRIEINKNFFNFLEDKVKEWKCGEEEQTEDSQIYQDVIDFFKKYGGYDVYIDRELKKEGQDG